MFSNAEYRRLFTSILFCSKTVNKFSSSSSFWKSNTRNCSASPEFFIVLRSLELCRLNSSLTSCLRAFYWHFKRSSALRAFFCWLFFRRVCFRLNKLSVSPSYFLNFSVKVSSTCDSICLETTIWLSLMLFMVFKVFSGLRCLFFFERSLRKILSWLLLALINLEFIIFSLLCSFPTDFLL